MAAKTKLTPLPRPELIERIIVNFLILNAVGRPNAIKRARLLEHINRALPQPEDPYDPAGQVGDETMRDICRHALAGIFACKDGYFLPAQAADGGVAELRDFEDYLKKKANGLFRRIRTIREAHPDLGPWRDQIPLDFEVEGGDDGEDIE